MQNLYVDSVAHRYGTKGVLNNVYLSCDIGEIVGILGRNGSGKSTLLKIIFGSVKPDYMHMKLNGRLINRAYLSGDISYLPQHVFIPSYLKVNHLIKLYTNAFRAELEQVKFISDHAEAVMHQLSGGQRRLVELLLILYSDSKFILLDEPFGQLSPILVEEIKEHLSAVKQRKGIILTDHSYRHILEISNRTILLHNGCNYKIDSTDDLQLHGYIKR